MYASILRNMIRKTPFIVLVVLLTSMFLSTAHPAVADQDQVPVSGDVFITFFTANCPSPVGLCGQGPISGNLLNGNLLGIITSVVPHPNELDLTASITITTKNGDLFANAILIEQLPSELTTATVNITGGTRRYKHTTGVLYFTEPARAVNGVLHFLYTGFLSKDAERQED